MQHIKPIFCLGLLIVLLPGAGHSQDLLRRYIREGLDSNLALRQKDFDLRKSELDLKRARALFYPRLNFNSDYTLAEGGRTQDIPIGDLLNNVYSTLNDLTSSGKFPQVSNQSIQFLPNDYHDTRLELSLPVVNPDIWYNRRVKEAVVHSREAGLDIYRRELVKNIKLAYYQYLQALRSVAIYTDALALVKENLRVSQKKVENTMATAEIVLRAKAQVSQVEASLIDAGNRRQNAAAYFNFLLNRPLDAPVGADSTLGDHPLPALSVSLDIPEKREELARLKSARQALESGLKMDRSYLVPRLNAFYHVGYQGYGFHFNNDQFYQLAGLQLQWNLFRGGDNKYKIRQSQIDIEAISDQYREAEQQMSLQVRTAYNNYRSATRFLEAVRAEMQSANETYRFTEKRFREGQALQIELIDARTQMTNAGIRFSLAQLAVRSQAAELERATASYTF